MSKKNLSIIIGAIWITMTLNACSTGKIAKPSSWLASSYKSSSSTKIGCLPDEITITDLNQHGMSSSRDWFATCNGKTFFCSGVNDGYGGTKDVSCFKSPTK